MNQIKCMEKCVLCPRRCGVNRLLGQKGFCRSGAVMKVARAALHPWEEPCISGEEGSGTVFFTGCSLGCSYCQNAAIAGGEGGEEVSVSRLVQIFFSLQEAGANNINLVTAGHYVPSCAQALREARKNGLSIPVVYNSSGYELPETLKMLDGLVDIYLPDFKYMDPAIAAEYSHAPDYPQAAKAAIGEMVRQAEAKSPGGAVFDARGIMLSGVIVRLLLLPGHVKDAKEIVRYLHGTYGDRIWISMMSQYTPMPAVASDALLGRKVTKREYERLIDYAVSIGVANGFIQEGETAEESFIPSFRGEGVRES